MMSKKAIFFVLIVVLLLGTAAFLFMIPGGGTYSSPVGIDTERWWVKGVFVSPGGNDSGSCTRADPCRTFDKAVSMVHPGETIHVLEGTYSEEFTITKSGTARDYISIVGYDAILPGVVVSGNYIVVSGMEVVGSESHGILVNGKHIIVEDSIVRHSVTENGEGVCHGDGWWGSGLKVQVGGENIILRRNSVYENCGEGIAVTRGVNVVVEDNIVRDNFSVNIYIDNSPFTVVQGNTVTCTGIYLRNNHRPTGIAVAEEFYEGWGAQRRNTSILNNMVDGCYDGIASWEPHVPDGMEINLLIKGNIVINGTRRSISIRWFNQNVWIENNTVYAPIHIINMDGVTLLDNIELEPE